MRTATASSSPRTITGSIVVRDALPRFTESAITESGISNPRFFTAVAHGVGILRLAISGTTVYYSYGTLAAASYTWSSLGTCDDQSNVGVVGNRVFWVNANVLYWRDFTTGTPGGTNSETITGHTQLRVAPVSSTVVFLASKNPTRPFWRLFFKNIGGTNTEMGTGFVAGSDMSEFHAILSDGAYYIYYMKDGYRSCFIVTRNGASSGEEYVIPMDVVDDTSLLRVGGIHEINSELLVTGILKRTSGLAMHIYLKATSWRDWPIKHSLAREMYIIQCDDTDLPGVFITSGSNVYYHTFGKRAISVMTTFFGYDNVSLETEYTSINNIKIEMQSNSSIRSAVNIGGSVSIDLNNEIEIYTTANAQTVLMATIGADNTVEEITPEGRALAVTGRGLGIKRLSQWTADSDFDYWSQTKQYSAPAALTEMARADGLWQHNLPEATGIILDELNEPGILYSVYRGSPYGTTVGEFYVPQISGLEARFGLILNYRRETTTSATDRTGENTTDRLIDGLAIIYDTSDNTLAVSRIEDGVWTELSSQSETIDKDTWVFVMASYTNGYLTVMRKNQGVVSWATDISAIGYDFGEYDYGRPAIYIENITQYFESMGFNSSDDIIPVVSNFGLSLTNEYLIIDDEVVQASTGGANYGPPTTRTMVDRITFPNAPHLNTYFQDGVLSSIPEGDEASQSICTALATNQYVGASFTLYSASEIEGGIIRVRKNGSPGPLYIWLANDNIDNGTNPLLSGVLGYTSIPAASIGASFSNISFTINTGYNGNTMPYSAVPDNYWFIFTNVAPGGSPTASGTNYYTIEINEGTQQTNGIMRLHGNSLYWYRRSPDGLPVFSVIGNGHAIGNGYPIHFNGGGGTQDRDYYNDMALVITSGPGKGRVFRITDYDYYAPQQWTPNRTYIYPDKWENHVGDLAHGSWTASSAHRIFVDRNPRGVIQAGSTAHIRPALHISARALEGSLQTSHYPSSGYKKVSVFRDASVFCRRFHHGSSDMDMTFDDMAREICHKAGVRITSEKHAYGDYALTTTPSLRRDKKNSIVKFRKETSTGGVLFIYWATEGPVSGRAVLVTSGGVSIGSYSSGSFTATDYIPSTLLLTNSFTVSVHDNFISAWENGRLIAFFVDNSTPQGNLSFFAMESGTGNVNIDWPELDLRVDNFIMESGARGAQMIGKLIGEKHIYFNDRPDGSVHFFRNRTMVNNGSPITTLAMASNVYDETQRATRIRVEGGGVAEAFNPTYMAEYGNLYALLNLTEVNSDADAVDEANYLIEDINKRTRMVSLIGPCDMRLEANDDIEVTLDGVTSDFSIDSISFNMSVMEGEAIFDMSVEAHDA